MFTPTRKTKANKYNRCLAAGPAMPVDMIFFSPYRVSMDVLTDVAGGYLVPKTSDEIPELYR